MGGGMGGRGGADGFAGGQPMAMGGVAASPVSGGVAGASVSGLVADGDEEEEMDGKLHGFGEGQAAQDSAKTLGAQPTRRYSGRTELESVESEVAVFGQALSIAGAREVTSESLNGEVERGFVAGKSAQTRKGRERDQSGAGSLDLQSELSQPAAALPEQQSVTRLGVDLADEVAKETGQAEVPALGDVPVLGRMFKRSAAPEKAARELTADQLERSADTKVPTDFDHASRESARQSLSLAKRDKDVLAELPVEEHESLTATLDEALPVPGSFRRQRLVEVDADKRRNSPATRQPESFARADRELLRRKGKAVGNKKLPASAKPESASRSSRMREAKREEKQLAEKLKETEPPAKPPAPSVVYTPRPETVAAENNFSTFSLNVSDVSFKTALASLQADKLPAPANVRSEEFLNSLEYRDPMPRAGEPLAFHWERARSPFAHDRDIIRFSVRTAALGRQPGRAVNLVCLLDNSGSMEREDRVS
ncbi:MAG: von Willebrand factor type A domain-containing protein, partial [Verrucomicrobiota bacterium]|nr:von Willebrand factor type A domain-containing protein [Verrucomicrobiota bacterium]